MTYRMDQITVTIIDASARARELFGDDASYIVGRDLPETDLRIHIAADDGVTKATMTCAPGARLSAENILALMNR